MKTDTPEGTKAKPAVVRLITEAEYPAYVRFVQEGYLTGDLVDGYDLNQLFTYPEGSAVFGVFYDVDPKTLQGGTLVLTGSAKPVADDAAMEKVLGVKLRFLRSCGVRFDLPGLVASRASRGSKAFKKEWALAHPELNDRAGGMAITYPSLRKEILRWAPLIGAYQVVAGRNVEANKVAQTAELYNTNTVPVPVHQLVGPVFKGPHMCNWTTLEQIPAAITALNADPNLHQLVWTGNGTIEAHVAGFKETGGQPFAYQPAEAYRDLWVPSLEVIRANGNVLPPL